MAAPHLPRGLRRGPELRCVVDLRMATGCRSGWRYARQRPGRVGFVLRDGDGDGHVVASLRPHRTVCSPASIIKSIFVTAFVNRRSVRDRPLRRWERQLLRPMIVRSDDGAANDGRDLLGNRRVLALARRAGMTDSATTPTDRAVLHQSRRHVEVFPATAGLLTPRHRATG